MPRVGDATRYTLTLFPALCGKRSQAKSPNVDDLGCAGHLRRSVVLGRPKQRRFYNEAGALLDALMSPKHAPTTHYTMELLEAFIEFDPRGAFLRIAEAVTSGVDSGYAGDSLGSALVVRIVERYLAEYRALLERDAECRSALVAVLDLFVEAGWPEASDQLPPPGHQSLSASLLR